MLIILLFALCVVLFAIVFEIHIEKVIPTLLMGMMLSVYLIALLAGSLSLAVNTTFILAFTILVVYLIVQKKVKNITIADKVESLKKHVFTMPLLIYILMIVITCFLFSNHYVCNWDDLSYWGTYAKTLLSIDKIPTALENCTIDYKDYPPIQQIMQYFFLHRISRFNDTNLFRVNVFFMYTLMLPFLAGIEWKKTPRISMALQTSLYIIFPHVFSTQFYYKLGVDYLMGILLGYSIYVVVEESENRIFSLISVIISSSYMALIKTSGAFLCIFITLFYCVYHWNETEIKKQRFARLIKNIIYTFAIPMLFYVSWKWWGKVSGNHGYLSDRVTSNIKTIKHDFPDYTLEVVINYIKHFFTYPLTRAGFGMSAAIMVVLIISMYFITKTINDNNLSRKILFVSMCIVSPIFCGAHIYMYLFVFDDWEAHGLLEFDRYIIQYLAGVFYFYVATFVSRCEILIKQKKCRFNPAVILLLVLIVFFPFGEFNRYLIPSHYQEYYETEWKLYSDKANVEWEDAQELFSKIEWVPSEDKKVGLIANAWSDELQFLLYKMVPQPVSFVFNLPAIEPDKLKSFIETQLQNRNITYVYIMTNSKESHEEEWDDETSQLTDTGLPLEEGRIYESVKEENNEWKLKKLY